MKHLRIENNTIVYPYNLDSLKDVYNDTSFPDNIAIINLSEFNVFEVIEIQKPDNESFTKIINEGVPELIEGIYYQKWIVEDAPVEYTQSMIESINNIQWNQVKNIRNQYLYESDWTQLSDSPLTEEKKQEWRVYRQALRDITLQEDPFNIVWPTKPE